MRQQESTLSMPLRGASSNIATHPLDRILFVVLANPAYEGIEPQSKAVVWIFECCVEPTLKQCWPSVPLGLLSDPPFDHRLCRIDSIVRLDRHGYKLTPQLGQYRLIPKAPSVRLATRLARIRNFSDVGVSWRADDRLLAPHNGEELRHIVCKHVNLDLASHG